MNDSDKGGRVSLMKVRTKIPLAGWWQAGCLAMLLAFAASATANAAGAISQSFTANNDNISSGALVSLVSTNSSTVQLANSSDVAKLVGIASSKPLVELSDSTKDNLPVVVSGSTTALVSNIGGNVETGDKITASPVNGIGMKASTSTEIVGTAQASLASVHTVKQTVKNRSGKSTTINVGLIPIGVNVGYYSAPASASKETLSSVLPPFLQSLANAIVGRTVSPLKVLVGALALVLGFIVAVVMLYSSIRTDIASIGRNPLAETALRKGFIDVVVAALGVLVITVAATYIILVA